MAEMPPKAYQNSEFLNGSQARPIRILAEYAEPRARLDRYRIRDTIVFFGSARFLDAEAASKRLAEAKTEEQRKLAETAVAGSRYYEDARRLAAMLTRWSEANANPDRHFVVCSGGGPGIMEAANRGAKEAGGVSVGFNISLPMEQEPNPYITPELSFQFHYFFMRKLWFAYLAKVLLVFPGGFGTLDELMELLTLAQTEKLRKEMLIIIYGKEYWDRVIDFKALAEMGTIAVEDLELFRWANTPEEAFDLLTPWLKEHYLKDLGPVP